MKRFYWTAAALAASTLLAAIVITHFAAQSLPPRPIQPSARERPAPVDTPAAVASRPVIGAAPLADLTSRRLKLPVRGISQEDLQRSFNDERVGHTHEAIDILAPRDTPVLAVEDGVIAKLFTSKAGGLTIYQFDPTSTYAYYYAHLERYDPSVSDGATVRRGQVIGYVGTSGNAPRGTPHLHFAIYKLTEEKKWWKGAPIDPYDVFR